MSADRCDAAVVGAGLYGSLVALHLAGRHGARVVLVEKDEGILRRASYGNQARVHNGYHYPRSLRTGLRSHVNYARFVDEYRDCIVDEFAQYYAIARKGSQVNANQFERFCRRVEAPLRPASERVARWFDPSLIERVYRVEECAFDAAALRKRIRRRLDASTVELRLNTEAVSVRADGSESTELECRRDGSVSRLRADRVYNCTYSRVNELLRASGLAPIPVKHEVAEIALVQVPEELEAAGVTVMCGPFFSVMPFPAEGLHSLSHVRYTPHFAWFAGDGRPADPPVPGEGGSDPYRVLERYERPSRFEHMRRDAARYLPALADCRHVSSLWEVKTVLPRSEADDSRPILMRRSEEAPGVTTVLGSKIDNVFDVLQALPA